MDTRAVANYTQGDLIARENARHLRSSFAKLEQQIFAGTATNGTGGGPSVSSLNSSQPSIPNSIQSSGSAWTHIGRSLPREQSAWGNFDQVVGVLKDAIGPGNYLINGTFSAADIMVGPMLEWGVANKIITDDGLKAYVDAVTRRPAYKRAAAIEKEQSDG